MKTRLGFGICLLAAGLSGCGPISLPNISPSAIDSVFSRVVQLSHQRVKVVFYNRLSNNELVPLVPDALESLRFNGQFSLDAGSFPRNRGLEQTFPFIEPGDHLIELTFTNQKKPIEVPIVVPESGSQETVILVILAFDASGNQVRDVQVGYDADNDRVLDTNANIYRSSNGQSYLVYSPDGQVKEWISPLDQANTDAAPNAAAAALPPGSTTTGKNTTELPSKTPDKTASPPPVITVPVPKPLPLPEPNAVTAP